MFSDKYRAWMSECANLINNRENEVKRHRLTAAVAAIFEVERKKKKRSYTKKRYWVHPIFELRQKHGFNSAIFHVLQLDDLRFKNYFRMLAVQLEVLLCLVGPQLAKKTLCRYPLNPQERLTLTLRYLASGDSMASMQYEHLCGLTTVSNVIGETCEAIWSCLRSRVLPSSLKKEDWLSIAKDFEETWNFAHCVGAIDGKHIPIQCPNNAGSAYFNYKSSHSIILLAICDARCLFTFVDIGSYGRRSDGGIFNDSTFGKKFITHQMNLPEPEPLYDGWPALPYCLLGDEAFPLTEYLLRPYPGRGELTTERNIFNYRLSRARRTIENTFGIVASQWRILRKPIICNVDKVVSIVKSIVCLHNWLRKQDIENGRIPKTDCSSVSNSTKLVPDKSASHNCAIREEFCRYFNSEGAVPWQFSHQ